MIRITSQSATNQYDSHGRAITTWDDKKCAWIVNTEFEHEQIDWYGKESDFPTGCTIAEYERMHPNWNKMPDISVCWYWNTKETCIKAFGLPHTFGENADYWDKRHYPEICFRDWGHLEYTKEQAIENLGKYCKFNIHADRVVVKYNGEVIHDGELK